ncbi:MAG: hypothetical protein ABI763_09785 [Bacteroidota bacterium]
MNAPIALFVYNRPEHSRIVLDFLAKNELAGESKLYIFADGPKKNASENDLKNIAAVRKLIRSKKWCQEVHIVEEPQNKGVDSSITTALIEFVNRHDKLIVLEDDIVTSKYFLTYMNQSLVKYEMEEEVMAISGYMFPVKGKLPETFFLHTGGGWGWGTWKRAWNQFNPDSKSLIDQLKKKNLVRRFNFDNTSNFFGMLKGHQEETIVEWDACWYATIFLKNRFTLYPHKSFTRNIGMDGSGTNYVGSEKETHIDVNAFNSWAEEKNSPKFTDRIELSKHAQDALTAYFRKLNSTSVMSKIKHEMSKNIFTR